MSHSRKDQVEVSEGRARNAKGSQEFVILGDRNSGTMEVLAQLGELPITRSACSHKC